MTRYAAIFGLFGFMASIVVALVGQAPWESTVRSALLWGATFAVIGMFLGRTAAVLLGESGPQTEGSTQPEERDGNNPKEDVQSTEESRGKNPWGDRAAEPIGTDEAE